MDAELQVGVDVGSTTAKAVVVDSSSRVLWKHYRRHGARQAEVVLEFMERIEARFPDARLRCWVTGSGGRVLAPHLGARYIQEVNAVTYTVEKLHPDTGSVVELGGQDAKVIIWQEDESGRKNTLTFMNDKCAGGTGATIDKIFSKVGVSPEHASSVRAQGKLIHHIAAKCGVFAETDVVGLVKSGVDRDEMIVSLLDAIVKQNLEVLVRGHVLRDKVLLLGGPHTFLPVLTDLWRSQIPELWELHAWTPCDGPVEDLVLVPQDSQYFAAIGAVLFGVEAEKLLESRQGSGDVGLYPGPEPLGDYISTGRLAQLTAHGAVRDGLVEDEGELERFRDRYAVEEFVPPVIEAGSSVRCRIGVDGGSTSSKMCLVDETGRLLWKSYMLSHGNPIEDVRDLFSELEGWRAARDLHLDIAGAAVTGYASEILERAFGFDLHVVETVAHMRAAVSRYGDVDIVCDIGGQDIKVLFLGHGRVVDFRLNTQCSAGNGYFLQGMAEQLGIPMEEYADHAFRARKAPAFNYGCAVFMEQDKVNFQQLGWTKEEIMAGLALVLPLNIWNYVVQESNIARFGRRVVLQGGTQRNLAAVKAQVDHIRSRVPDAEVFVHPDSDICGALGAALEARGSESEEGSRFVGTKGAMQVEFTTRNDETTRCRFCPNRCPRAFVDIRLPSGEITRFISGNGCEKGLAQDREAMVRQERERRIITERYPNLADEARRMVFADQEFDYPPPGMRRSSREARAHRAAMVVGIPRLLNMWAYAPFFNAYLRTLGVGEVVTSGDTSRKMWSEGNRYGSIDPCFPAKVAPAHVLDLIRRESVTHVCFPIVTHIGSHLHRTLGNNACVIQMGTPEVVHAAFTRGRDHFRERGVGYWKPFVHLDRHEETADQLLEYFERRLMITSEENAWAVEQGFTALEAYHRKLEERGREVINRLVENDRIGIVVLGHPYHHDPGLNHGLLDEFQKRGYPILCVESIPKDAQFLAPLFPGEGELEQMLDVGDVWLRNFNRNTNHKVWAAKVVARHPNLAAIDLSSFKCGHDAPTYSYVDNIMDTSGTPHFHFHDIDQNKPHASMKIRIQTIDYFLKTEEERLEARVKELSRHG